MINFSLPNKDGTIITLEEINADFVVLYFYPKDNTPGCTVEAKEFSDLKSQFEKLGAVVIGISGGTQKTKQKFCDTNALTIELLTDEDFAVSKLYNSYGEKKFMGRTYNGIYRNTFILNKEKDIIHTFEQVKPQGHAKEVLAYIEKKLS